MAATTSMSLNVRNQELNLVPDWTYDIDQLIRQDVAEGFTLPQLGMTNQVLGPNWKGTSTWGEISRTRANLTIISLPKQYPHESAVARLPTSDDPLNNIDFRAALEDLRRVTNGAVEEGFPMPSSKAQSNAERLLEALYKISPRRFDIYPTPDGEVAIDAHESYGMSVVVLCDGNGEVLCLVNMGERRRYARYSTTDKLPDGFIREALIELKENDV